MRITPYKGLQCFPSMLASSEADQRQAPSCGVRPEEKCRLDIAVVGLGQEVGGSFAMRCFWIARNNRDPLLVHSEGHVFAEEVEPRAEPVGVCSRAKAVAHGYLPLVNEFFRDRQRLGQLS